jgi:large subunit ribosomal protein L9
VARNADEAERQARGEDMSQRREETDDEAAVAEAESVFEKPEDAEVQGNGDDEKTD